MVFFTLISYWGRKKAAKKNYKDFVETADTKTLENPSRLVTEGFILGDMDFVTPLTPFLDFSIGT